MDQMQIMDMEYKPWGGLAGAYHGIQAAQMEDSNANKLQAQTLENAIRGVEAGRAMSDFQNPEMEKQRQAGIIGQGQSLQAKGQFDIGTIQAKIKDQLAEYASKVPEHQFKKEQHEAANRLNAMGTAYQMLEANQWNPGAIQQVAQTLGPQLGASPEMVKGLVSAGPDAIKKFFQSTMMADKEMLSYTPTVRQHIAQKAPELANDKEIHAADRASAERVAAGNNAATRYSADQHLAGVREHNAASEKVRNLEQMAAQEMELANRAKDPAVKQQHLGNAEQLVKFAERLRAAPAIIKAEADANNPIRQAIAAELSKKKGQPQVGQSSSSPKVIKLD